MKYFIMTIDSSLTEENTIDPNILTYYDYSFMVKTKYSHSQTIIFII